MLFSSLASSGSYIQLAISISEGFCYCCCDADAYLSRKLEVFLRIASQGEGLPPSSFKEEMSDRRHLRCRYSDAASRSASAFLSGQLKCFRTAVSSDYRIVGDLDFGAEVSKLHR